MRYYMSTSSATASHPQREVSEDAVIATPGAELSLSKKRRMLSVMLSRAAQRGVAYM